MILYTFDSPTRPDHIQRISTLLQKGGLIAYPTDVNWAFGCIASHQKALKRLHALRPRREAKTHPLSLLFADISQLSSYADISDRNTFRILKKILPGPYTILLPRHRRLPKILSDNRQELGIRIPQRPFLQDLIHHISFPLATTTIFLPPSASTFTSTSLSHDSSDSGTGEDPSPAMPSHSYEIEQHFSHALDMIVDLDISQHQPPTLTTIIDLRSHPPTALRMGTGPWP